MNGFVLVDKPAGPSSHTAVQQLRRTLGIGGRRGTKAGHAGTLDPFASGLLVVLVGRATRLMPFVVGHDKRYLMDVRFGASSTTDDATGELTPGPGTPDSSDVEAALEQLRASTEQVPPAVSAIHLDGERAYQRVRRGEIVEVPARPVRFDAIELLAWHEPAAEQLGTRVVIDVRCGSGAYMRALARDLGELVGCPAHCEALRRTAVGQWTVEGAPEPGAVSRAHVHSAVEALGSDVPRVQLGDAEQLADIAAGRRIACEPGATSAPETVALIAPDGSLAAIAMREGAVVHPRTVFIDPAQSGVGGS